MLLPNISLNSGLKQRKENSMTNEEAIIYLKQLYPNGGHCWLDEQRIEAIGMAIKALQKEPASEDLEEAAKRYATEGDEISGLYIIDEEVDAFIAGAKWQKERIMENSTSATIGLPYENKDGGYTHLIDVSRPLSVGNNKIAIIFKE